MTDVGFAARNATFDYPIAGPAIPPSRVAGDPLTGPDVDRERARYCNETDADLVISRHCTHSSPSDLKITDLRVAVVNFEEFFATERDQILDFHGPAEIRVVDVREHRRARAVALLDDRVDTAGFLQPLEVLAIHRQNIIILFKIFLTNLPGPAFIEVGTNPLTDLPRPVSCPTARLGGIGTC